ncbi:MAG TPA: DUF6777 domain-containing protein [Candidatus Dormibacteraeota bacterium]|nr:DUF6777 domain-containing protein [Candidatus Dormibacteraeota bacterium]
MVLGGGGAYILLNQSSHEVLLEPAMAIGPDPYLAGQLPSPGPTAVAEAPSPTPVPKGGGATPRVTPPASAGGVVALTPVGSRYAIYGGTGDNRVCDKAKLVAFLTTHPGQGQAWAGVLGITVAQIPGFVAGLSPAILSKDTRVTNHGYSGGKATPRQSVLQAGTAVLVDSRGVPVSRCLCGNPLLPPAAVQGTVKYTGPKWPAFQPSQTVAVTTAMIAQAMAAPSAPAGASPSPSPVARATASPVQVTPTPTASPTSVTNLAAHGHVVASSSLGPAFAPSMAVDNDPRTSWLSAGPQADGTTTLTLTLAAPATIVSVEVVGNITNSNAQYQTGHGFGSWSVELLDAQGRLLHTYQNQRPGDQTQGVSGPPIGGVVKVVFVGRSPQSPTADGIAELQVFGGTG